MGSMAAATGGAYSLNHTDGSKNGGFYVMTKDGQPK